MEATDGCAADPAVRGGAAAGDETAAADVTPETVHRIIQDGVLPLLWAMAAGKREVAA